MGPCARRRAPQLRQYRQGAADGPVHRAAGGGCESPERVLNRLPDPAKKRPDRNLSGLFYRVRLEIMPKKLHVQRH
ncbi:Aldolase, partial [Dysosmobacter welbionis]